MLDSPTEIHSASAKNEIQFGGEFSHFHQHRQDAIDGKPGVFDIQLILNTFTEV